MRWSLIGLILLATQVQAQDREARPLGALLRDGGRVVAAAESLLWVETKADLWMCVIEISDRFRASLKHRRVRELYASWPGSLCFNARSFE